jgi:thiamine biosynthesis protein ThiS
MEIEITLNGEPQHVPEGTSVADLIGRLELVPEQVAVERNRSLVRRAEHASTRLEAGDEVEVVTLVGGG